MALGGLLGGCSSLISSSALVLMATSLIGSAVVFFKRKK